MVKASIIIFSTSTLIAPTLAAVAADWKMYQARSLSPESAGPDLTAREDAGYESMYARAGAGTVVAVGKTLVTAFKHHHKHHPKDITHAVETGSNVVNNLNSNSRRDLSEQDEELFARGGGSAAGKAAVKFLKKHHHHIETGVNAVTNNDRRELAYEELDARQFDLENDSVLYERSLLEDQDLYARAFYDEEDDLYARSSVNFLEDLD